VNVTRSFADLSAIVFVREPEAILFASEVSIGSSSFKLFPAFSTSSSNN